MDDIVPGLLEKIQKEIEEQYQRNDEIKRVLQIIQNNKGTYEEADIYAFELGSILSNCLDSNFSKSLPDDTLYYNIAKRILGDTYTYNFSLISDASIKVQQALNEKAGIGLKVIPPEFNQPKFDSIINSVSPSATNKEKKYTQVASNLKEMTLTFSQEIVEDTLKRNVDAHYRAGLSPKVIRKVSPGCTCERCLASQGTFEYPDVPDYVWKRHDNCRCLVLYYPGEGRKYQNVHSKVWVDKEEVEKRIKFSTSNVSKYAKDVTAEYYGTMTPGKGNIEIEPGVKEDERKMAQFIFENFGGNITAKREVMKDNVKNPDYIWNEKLWDLKTLSSEKAAYSAVRSGIKQIFSNPGGLILDYRNSSENDIQLIINEVDDRMQRTKIKTVDIMIIKGNGNIKIYRYKKE